MKSTLLPFILLLPSLALCPLEAPKSSSEQLRLVRESILQGELPKSEHHLLAWLAWETDSLYRDTAEEMLTTLWWGQKYWGKLDSFYAVSSISPEDHTMVAFIHGLSKAPQEVVEFDSPSEKIPMKLRYQSGNPEITCKVNGKKNKGIVDTGAGITLVSRSFARKMGIYFLDSTHGHAISASGKSIPMQAGYIPSLKLGNALIKNAVVGIVEDRLMEFRMLGMKVIDIDFVIGWNILQELALEYDLQRGLLTVFNPNSFPVIEEQNLFWYSIPMIKVRDENSGRAMYMELDFGGTESNAYSALLEMDTSLRPIWSEDHFGGAGGFTEYHSFVLPKICLLLANDTACFEDIRSRPNHQPYRALKPCGVLGLGIAAGGSIVINPKRGTAILKIVDAR